jgi:tRNA A-37 threonylcarbamoyl transferase component Bud32
MSLKLEGTGCRPWEEIRESIATIIADPKLYISEGMFSLYSRNTIIGSIESQGGKYFAKINLGDSAHMLVEQEAKALGMLKDMFAELPRIQFPSVYGFDSSTGVLVTEYINAPSISELLRREYKLGKRASRLVEISTKLGSTLRVFHDHTRTLDGKVVLYGDFSPNNMMYDLIESVATLIDPPRKLELGDFEKDLGVALFELTRVMVKTGFGLISIGISRRAILSSYFSDISINCNLIDTIHHAEKNHFWEVCRRYKWFWRYKDWFRQLLRGGAYLTLLYIYRITVMPLVQRADFRVTKY